ncbi:DciA family protein [Streptomyces sp. NPDC089799]|uniref:DciA family protein n=1 Tax=Streptomyces sp. NPDC089799 TaxID=3155066 RepID=UPI00341E78BB
MINNSASAPQAPESGVDLARQALAAARAAAKQRGARPSGSRKAHRTRATRQPDGREPIGFQQLLANLITDRAWELPAAGGSLVDEWPTIATDLAGHVALAGYDAATGELAVRPVSAPYATAARLHTRQIIDAANHVMRSTTAVRTLRILPPGITPTAPYPADTTPATPEPAVPVQQAPHYEQPAGYRQALALHHAHRFTHRADAHIAQAAREQIRTRILEPEHAFREGLAEAEHLREQAERNKATNTAESRALARARSEKAGLTRLPHQATAAQY